MRRASHVANGKARGCSRARTGAASGTVGVEWASEAAASDRTLDAASGPRDRRDRHREPEPLRGSRTPRRVLDRPANVGKYAGATAASVHLSRTDTGVAIEIADD